MSDRRRQIINLMGAGFALQGVVWVILPHRAAEGLGMPALDGIGRSTQFGDFAAFFLVLGVSILIGNRPGHTRTLNFPAALLATAAVCRTLAWMIHGAAFAALFIAVETVCALLLFSAARQISVRRL